MTGDRRQGGLTGGGLKGFAVAFAFALAFAVVSAVTCDLLPIACCLSFVFLCVRSLH
jgi:hypothetical protein